MELAHGYCLSERVVTIDEVGKSCCPIVGRFAYHPGGKLTYISG